MNSDSVIKGFDVFKNQVVCVSVILNVKTVKPFPLYLGFVIAWTDYGNVAVIVLVLWFPSGKGANADPGSLHIEVVWNQDAPYDSWWHPVWIVWYVVFLA